MVSEREQQRTAESVSTAWLDLLATPFSQRWVDAGEVRTRAIVSGEQHEDALILLHGTGGHAEAYTRNLGSHGEHFRTYAIDLLGHGFTDKPDVPYEMDAYVEHVRAFMDAEGIDTAAISGESLGGWVAGKFALAYPDRVSRIVMNTAGGYTSDPEVMERIRTLTMAAVTEASWDSVKRRLEWLMADPATVTAELIALRLAIYRQPGFVSAMERILCLQDPEIRRRNMFSDDELRRIDVPTLVLWTSHDPTGAVEVGEAFDALIPDSRLVVLDGCGHWPQFEAPAEFDRVHLDFLTAGRRGGSGGGEA